MINRMWITEPCSSTFQAQPWPFGTCNTSERQCERTGVLKNGDRTCQMCLKVWKGCLCPFLRQFPFKKTKNWWNSLGCLNLNHTWTPLGGTAGAAHISCSNSAGGGPAQALKVAEDVNGLENTKPLNMVENRSCGMRSTKLVSWEKEQFGFISFQSKW